MKLGVQLKRTIGLDFSDAMASSAHSASAEPRVDHGKVHAQSRDALVVSLQPLGRTAQEASLRCGLGGNEEFRAAVQRLPIGKTWAGLLDRTRGTTIPRASVHRASPHRSRIPWQPASRKPHRRRPAKPRAPGRHRPRTWLRRPRRCRPARTRLHSRPPPGCDRRLPPRPAGWSSCGAGFELDRRHSRNP